MPTISISRPRLVDWALALTVLVSAWLLFQVQPMASKRILPWFGGGPAVWTAAMLFFQAALLGGYLYAHLTTRLLRPRVQLLVHTALLAAAGGMLAVNGSIAPAAMKPADSGQPLASILVILSFTVGLPYLMLAATAPLVQTWFARTHDARSPYRLYALSNFGSLAALISYPLAFEPVMGLAAQGALWSSLFAGFAALCALVGWLAAGAAGAREFGREATSGDAPASLAPAPSATVVAPMPTMVTRVLWVGLPACASVVLLAATNFLCQDVAALPLLWIAPLALYLITFILSFDSDRWYRRWAWLPALAGASFAAQSVWEAGAGEALTSQVGIHLALVASVGMACHGEVARLRPPRQLLTSYYLYLAAGGALGGLLVALAAPVWFGDYYELPLAVLATWLFVAAAVAADRNAALRKRRFAAVWIVAACLWAGLAALMWNHFHEVGQVAAAQARNFFGVIKLQQRQMEDGTRYRQLLHGRILHGAQFVEPNRRREPTMYYGANSGVGLLLKVADAQPPRRVGLVGLGAGTLAAYAEAGDEYRFYEINERVVEFADNYFSYLDDARTRGATIEFVVADARVALEREEAQQFDCLALDAFSGDAIPVHLLTMEAFEHYFRHLKSTGVLAVHITNRHLDLAPVVAAAAERFERDATIVTSGVDEKRNLQTAVWIMLYPRSASDEPPRVGQPLALEPPHGEPIVWTDDYSSLLGILEPP